MFDKFIEERPDGVKVAYVLDNKRTLVEKISARYGKLVLAKLPEREDVSLFLSSGYDEDKKFLDERTCIANKEEALKLIYSLKVLLNITNEDVQTFEESLVI